MLKLLLRNLLSFIMISAGVMHFVDPARFVRIVPDYLPYPNELVSISGVFEILGGIGLMIPALRVYAAWGLVALFIAVFPANVHMAINQIPFGEAPTPVYLLWLRLPIQFLLIAWARWYTK